MGNESGERQNSPLSSSLGEIFGDWISARFNSSPPSNAEFSAEFKQTNKMEEQEKKKLFEDLGDQKIFASYEDFCAAFFDNSGEFRFKPVYYFYKWREEKGFGLDYPINLDDLYRWVMYISYSRLGLSECNGEEIIIQLKDSYAIFVSKNYKTDTHYGHCEDGDNGKVRYINLKTGKVFKMKAGKFISSILREEQYGFPEQVVNYVSERFAAEWASINLAESNEYKLHVDDDFKGIYSSDRCADDFNSCMTDKGHYDYFADAIDCSAAYITDVNDRIVARCILYNNVHDDETGESGIRLAERQYSVNANLRFKQILVDMLIAENKIDGYKRVGASYSDRRQYISVSGEDWHNRKFWIDCDLHEGDHLSFQDSFYAYDGVGKATNYGVGEYDLATCDDYFCMDEKYYTWDAVRRQYFPAKSSHDWVVENCVEINGEYYDTWQYIDGDYYTMDSGEIVYSDFYSEYFLIDDAVEIDGDWYKKEECFCFDSEWYFKGITSTVELDVPFDGETTCPAELAVKIGGRYFYEKYTDKYNYKDLELAVYKDICFLPVHYHDNIDAELIKYIKDDLNIEKFEYDGHVIKTEEYENA
jgi:hypothetical protein